MLRLALLVLALTASTNCILPEIVNSNIIQTLEEHLAQGRTESKDRFAVEQLGDTQQAPEDAGHQMDNDGAEFIQDGNNLPSSHDDETNSSENVFVNQSVQTVERGAEEETYNTTEETEPHLAMTTETDNSINHECVIDEDCEKGRYCLYEIHSSKCLPCKEIDVPCTKDEECCTGQLCVWGQCSHNATKGEAGSICQYQSECSTDLCCAFHKALLFPVCSAKPIERERCYGPSNHLMALLSWDMDGEGPREHCPCSGDLQCQPLGRGSLCLQGQNSSEEDLTDTLYSEIDYIV